MVENKNFRVLFVKKSLLFCFAPLNQELPNCCLSKLDLLINLYEFGIALILIFHQLNECYDLDTIFSYDVVQNVCKNSSILFIEDEFRFVL